MYPHSFCTSEMAAAVSPVAKRALTSSLVTKGLTAARNPALAVNDSGP